MNEEKMLVDYNEYYSKFFVASTIYAFIATIFLFKNYNGISISFFAVATVLYAIYCMNISKVKIKFGSKILMSFIILLGISTFRTCDDVIVCFNYLMMFITLIILFIHSYTNDEKWQFIEYVISFIITTICPIGCIKSVFPQNKNGEESKDFKFGYIILGIVISVCLLIVIMPLLLSADKIFSEIVKKYINIQDVFGFAFLFIFLLFASFCGVRYLNTNGANVELRNYKKINELLGITTFSIISVVYVAFSIVQIFGLFLNKMKLPADVTYSTYARSGFFQLLLVATINLFIIVISFYIFNKSKTIKLLLSIISISTYIMLFSSVYRLILYIQVYQLTKLRIYAMWGLIIVLFGLTGAVISIFNDKFRLVQYGYLVLIFLWTLLSFLRPEYIISKYNLSVKNKSGDNNYVDIEYLSKFSADASLPIYEYLDKHRDELEKDISLDEKEKLSQDYPGYDLTYLKKYYFHIGDTTSDDKQNNTDEQNIENEFLRFNYSRNDYIKCKEKLIK